MFIAALFTIAALEAHFNFLFYIYINVYFFN